MEDIKYFSEVTENSHICRNLAPICINVSTSFKYKAMQSQVPLGEGTNTHIPASRHILMKSGKRFVILLKIVLYFLKHDDSDGDYSL